MQQNIRDLVSLPPNRQAVGCKWVFRFKENAYDSWKQQVEPIIKSLRLHKFVVNPVIPPRFLYDDDCASGTMNLTYEEWEVQDQILLFWLQSTMSKSILSRIPWTIFLAYISCQTFVIESIL